MNERTFCSVSMSIPILIPSFVVMLFQDNVAGVGIIETEDNAQVSIFNSRFTSNTITGPATGSLDVGILRLRTRGGGSVENCCFEDNMYPTAAIYDAGTGNYTFSRNFGAGNSIPDPAAGCPDILSFSASGNFTCIDFDSQTCLFEPPDTDSSFGNRNALTPIVASVSAMVVFSLL